MNARVTKVIGSVTDSPALERNHGSIAISGDTIIQHVALNLDGSDFDAYSQIPADWS
jgi:hypothetical protein